MNKKRKSFGEVPRGITNNLKSPESAPADKRFTGRNYQVNFKVREELYWKMKDIANRDRIMMAELLEQSLEAYEKDKN